MAFLVRDYWGFGLGNCCCVHYWIPLEFACGESLYEETSYQKSMKRVSDGFGCWTLSAGGWQHIYTCPSCWVFLRWHIIINERWLSDSSNLVFLPNSRHSLACMYSVNPRLQPDTFFSGWSICKDAMLRSPVVSTKPIFFILLLLTRYHVRF